MNLRYRVVDVFTRTPLEGNPLAVFPDPADLDSVTMQRIARELNLSETVFVAPSVRPDCAARLRIFSPQSELDFAGHPTVGTAWVLLDEKVVTGPNFAVEENVGAVPVAVDPGVDPLIWLTTPPIKDGPVFDRAMCAQALRLELDDLADPPPQLLSAGNPTVFIPLKTKEAVDRARLSSAFPSPACVFVFAPTPEGAWSRMFAPHFGIIEDPATGSSTGPLAAYMKRHGMIASNRFISEQGTKMGRRSILHVRMENERIDVGGHVTPLIDAVMRF